MNAAEILDKARGTEGGITLTFDRADILHSMRTKLYRHIQTERTKVERDYARALDEGYVGGAPELMWGNVNMRKSGLKLWIGMDTLENSGILNIEEGNTT